MIIAFETKRLRTICEDDKVATKELGPVVADALRERLADLRAADLINELIVGNPAISGSDGSTLTISLTTDTRTVWSPNHVHDRRSANGDIDWDQTSRVRLLSIEGI